MRFLGFMKFGLRLELLLLQQLLLPPLPLLVLHCQRLANQRLFCLLAREPNSTSHALLPHTWVQQASQVAFFEDRKQDCTQACVVGAGAGCGGGSLEAADG